MLLGARLQASALRPLLGLVDRQLGQRPRGFRIRMAGHTGNPEAAEREQSGRGDPSTQ
jgi:hypothetical protein